MGDTLCYTASREQQSLQSMLFSEKFLDISLIFSIFVQRNVVENWKFYEHIDKPLK